MGLRDYSGWLFDILPGRVAATDLDFVLEQHNTGRVLVLEFKPTTYVPRGQSLVFDTLTSIGWDVWIVGDKNLDKDELVVKKWGKRAETMNLETFRTKVGDWWTDGEQ